MKDIIKAIGLLGVTIVMTTSLLNHVSIVTSLYRSVIVLVAIYAAGFIFYIVSVIILQPAVDKQTPPTEPKEDSKTVS